MQPQTHLFSDVHEQIIENFEHYRVDASVDGSHGRSINDSAQFQISGRRCARAPTRLDHSRGVALDDDGGTMDGCTGRQAITNIEFAHAQAGGCVVGETVHADLGLRVRFVSRRNASRRVGVLHGRACAAFYGDRFEHQRAVRHQKGKTQTVRVFELSPNRGARGECR